VCAALRCRKTLLAVELSADGGCAAAALHACTDRLEVALTQVSRPGELAAAAGRAIRARSAVLASGPAESLINEVSGVLARLRERGLLGDCLLWASGCEAVRPGQLGALLDLGPATGTALLLSTTSSACARALAAQVDVGVVCGPVSPDESACVVSPPDADASKALRRQRRGEFTLIGGDQVRTRCLAVPITAGGR
jgi:hypothetical protein